jgi:hypothetical protein
MDVIRHQMPLLDAAFLAARKIVKHLAQMPSDEIGMDRADNHYPTMTIGAICELKVPAAALKVTRLTLKPASSTAAVSA